MMLERQAFARMAGITFDGKRDLYQIFGYRRDLTPLDHMERYERGGVAGRVVDALPNATWRGGLEIEEVDDPEVETALEKGWYNLEQKHHVTAKLLQVDILSRLSTYAILLIGAPGKLDTPLPKGKGDPTKLLYFQAYMGAGGPNAPDISRSGRFGAQYVDATIHEFDTDPESERFAMPTFYQLRRTDFSSPDFQTPVHWSRVVHVAENPLSDEVYGRPCLSRVWNLFDDLEKVTGGGSEAFFQRAHQGRVWSIDKDVQGLSEPEMTKFREEIDQFQHGLTRDVRVRGVTVQPLGSDVAQFGPNTDAIITQIAGATGIPKRILTGSEMGELASSQDRDNWRDQINGRREQHAEPFILRRLIDRLIEYNWLPKPTKVKPMPPPDVTQPSLTAAPDITKPPVKKPFMKAAAGAVPDKPTKGAPVQGKTTEAHDDDVNKDEPTTEWHIKWGTVLNKTTEERDAELAAMWAAKTDEGPVFTNAEIRRETYDWEPLDDQQKADIAQQKLDKAKMDVDLEAHKADKLGTVAQKFEPKLPPGKKLRAAEEIAEDIDDVMVEAFRAALEAGDDDALLCLLDSVTVEQE
jgi:hypothetical protein